MGTVELAARLFPQGQGYDVPAASNDATVADYVRAVEAFCADVAWTRLRGKEPGRLCAGWADCEGCSGCCRERIPLTIADAINLARAWQKQRGQSSEPVAWTAVLEALGQWAEVEVIDGAVDIRLRRDEQGWCLFFDGAAGRCREHPWRPLVCRTFFCTVSSHRADRLRQRIVNAGEDELVRQLCLDHAWCDKHGVQREDYQETAWSVGEVNRLDLPLAWTNLIPLRSFSQHLGLRNLGLSSLTDDGILKKSSE
ncbi:YkgJ family cysteine cluster protein [Heliophilum fasciatum]|uniref:Putative zinc-or iron-chelating protein n=1 Tax=Heliophilum fasciatum TaxID=35700 RepID=A0A4R2RWV1_9FIRM|nr:YkgJ family cysteine cluster protein [Heliophilum fasciatum]MCW2277421.1 Fe-S-cluster containining protein [Heliophilum fasciatum]TCP67257.1 putative zinc- or iron-chelating protein [Heliophilum fasciatum]